MAMHSNWNPWHGCIKCSEGCQNCYVYYLDRMRGKDGANIYRTKTDFKYPLSKDRKGNYKIQRGLREYEDACLKDGEMDGTIFCSM